MSSLNQCQFIGNLGADPEVKSFSNGGRICNLRLACTEKWKDRASGEQKDRTEWISVTINNDGLVGVAEKYLRKGSKLYVSGKLTTRKWQDQNGNDRYSTEVVVGFDGKLILLGDNTQRQTSEPARSSSPASQSGGFDDGFGDDQIPF